jgi:hypothetical protein
MDYVKTVSDLIASLEYLKNKYGDLQVIMDVRDDTWLIHSVNYATTEEHGEFISLNNFD